LEVAGFEVVLAGVEGSAFGGVGLEFADLDGVAGEGVDFEGAVFEDAVLDAADFDVDLEGVVGGAGVSAGA